MDVLACEIKRGSAKVNLAGRHSGRQQVCFAPSTELICIRKIKTDLVPRTSSRCAQERSRVAAFHFRRPRHTNRICPVTLGVAAGDCD